MSTTEQDYSRAAAKGIDIAFIVIGLIFIVVLGGLFLRGVIGHIRYLTADDKQTVTARFVSVTEHRGKATTDYDGSVSYESVYDITYEYSIGDRPRTYVRKNRASYNEKDIKLRLYRNGSEEFRETDMYGMWAATHWTLMFLSVYIGIRLIRSGVKSLRKSGQNPPDAQKPDAAPPQV